MKCEIWRDLFGRPVWFAACYECYLVEDFPTWQAAMDWADHHVRNDKPRKGDT